MSVPHARIPQTLDEWDVRPELFNVVLDLLSHF